MKKICKKLLLVGGLMLIPAISIWLCNSNSRVSLKEENALKEKTIAMFVQNGDGNYDESTSDEFPKEGYTLNTEKSSCKNGGTLSQNRITKKIKLKASNSDSCTLYFDKIQSPASAATLAALNATSNGIKTSGFENPATTDEGIFEMEDDYGISYYYRGAVENNYIMFANSFWRIIRINGDGSLRILYDGPEAYANGTSDATRVDLRNVAWNETNSDDAKYVGYMYGGANGETSTSKEQAQTNQTDSNIKKELDSWYNYNIRNAFCDGAVTDTIFCNDRSTPNTSYALGYGSNETWYGGYSRFLTNQEKSQPTFKCEQKNDAFTVNDTRVGNGALTKPIGLITADEIMAAGSGKLETTNTSYYLYKTNSYFCWSLSPYYFGGSAGVFIVGSTGALGDGDVHSSGAVAPVINISIEGAKMTGDGTMENPYIPKYKLTIHLVDEATGEKIADDIINYHYIGEWHWDYVPASIDWNEDGYIPNESQVVGYMPNYDKEVTVTYYNASIVEPPDPDVPVEPAEPAP